MGPEICDEINGLHDAAILVACYSFGAARLEI